MPLPLPTNTPGPICTDDLLPMMTLGCGDELDRVPSGQRMLSPSRTPRRPSSQLTSLPWRVPRWAWVAPAPQIAGPRTPAVQPLVVLIPILHTLVLAPPNNRYHAVVFLRSVPTP